MKRLLSPQVIIAGFIFLFISVFITQLLTKKITYNSKAAENNSTIKSNTYSATLCPLSTEIYVNELMPDGSEIPFDFSQHRETEALQWGFIDEIHLTADSESRIPFNQGSKALYQSTSGELSFINIASPEDVYPQEKQTYVQLLYDQDMFEIIRKEVKDCSEGKSDRWLCLDTPAAGSTEDELDTHYGIKLRCNMNLSLGWIVKAKKNSLIGTNDAKPVVGLECDINLDNACNSIDLFSVIEDYGINGQYSPSDINKDFRVDAKDYSIVMAYLMK